MLRKLILHHNDRDGYMSAAIIIDYFNSIHNIICSYENISLNHTKPIISYLNNINIDEYDEIFVVDYGISLKEDHDFMKKYSDKIVWIDHHIGSMTDPMNEDLKGINGFRCAGMSGALLTWTYFYDFHSTCLFIKDNNAIVTQKQLDERFKYNWDKMPITVWYTHRYDTWDIDEQVISFNFGYHVDNINAMLQDLQNIQEYGDKYSETYMANVNKNGFYIKSHITKSNESFINQYGIPFTLRFKGRCYKALMANMPMPSSLKFGKYADEVDILFPFFYTGDGYSYSLYKTKLAPEDLNVSEIAKLFNGGGHKNAAGFFIHKRDMQVRPSSGAIYSIDE